jgi:phytoene dehydrogenase-like protein
MNGYSTAIFEKNSDCGGVSYAWKRGDYTFDGASNWLAGSSPASSMHNLLSELLDFSQLEIIDPDIFISVVVSAIDVQCLL